ncbi:MAG: hypothetical protein JWM02_433, partial [Frankiales bacterium]|nr:hypothetical protein [Frankiales bacterium]
LVVDGANVVGSQPTGWWKDRAGAAATLHGRLVAAVRDGSLQQPVVLVLEGRARPGVSEGMVDGVRVVHAPGEGDDTLVEAATRSPEPVTVVTADRGLADRVRQVGGQVVGPRWLLDRLPP